MNGGNLENPQLAHHLNPPVRFEFALIFVKVLIAIMFMFPLAHYSMYGNKSSDNSEDIENVENTRNDPQNITSNSSGIPQEIVKTRLVIQPHCKAPNEDSILQEIVAELVFDATTCTPEDFENEEKRKIPVQFRKNSVAADPRASIVSFVTVGLVLVSLGAAILDLYRAKKRATAAALKASKTPGLNRKCSLADLTVLKHQRKELMRRDSIILEHQQHENRQNQAVRAPKLQSLQRSSSCSTPGAEFITDTTSISTFNRSLDSRRGSIADNQQFNRLVNADSRKYSVVDAVDASGRRVSVDFASVTSSPERKHHSRLVTRR